MIVSAMTHGSANPSANYNYIIISFTVTSAAQLITSFVSPSDRLGPAQQRVQDPWTIVAIRGDHRQSTCDTIESRAGDNTRGIGLFCLSSFDSCTADRYAGCLTPGFRKQAPSSPSVTHAHHLGLPTYSPTVHRGLLCRSASLAR